MEMGLIFFILIFFIGGLLFGSFYNVVSIRTLKGEGLSYPPSHCVNCKHKLSYKDLVPVFSWMFLKGKCRYCGEKISPVYPLIEMLTGLSYALLYYQIGQYGMNLEFWIHIIFVTVLILATATDLKEMIVPDRFIVGGLVIVLILRFIESGTTLPYYLLSGAAAFIAMLLIFFLSKGRMGGADIKLYALIGLAIGWQSSIDSLFLASIIALVYYAVVSLLNKGKKFNLKLEIPFVPFITLGVLCTYFVNIFQF